MIKKILAALLILSAVACMQKKSQEQSKESSSIPEKQHSDEIKQKGAAIAGEMQQTLSRHLSTAISDSGISYALNYCNLQALPLTDSIADLHNVRISRISHRPRNPVNTATALEKNIISGYIAANEEGEALQPIVEEHEDHFTFYAPIKIASPLCLNCHGIPDSDIAPKDFILISMLYPEDKATGFHLNELRGLWKIEFSKNNVAL